MAAAETPKKPHHSSRNPKLQPQFTPKPSPSLTPATPQTLAPRRSTRQHPLPDQDHNPIENSPKTPRNVRKLFDPKTPPKSIDSAKEPALCSARNAKTPKSAKKGEKLRQKDGGDLYQVEVSFSPVSPEQSEKTTKKRKRDKERTVVTRAMASKKSDAAQRPRPKKRVYYKKVVYDGGEFEVGNDVYVKRREDTSSDDEVPEMEECRVCFKVGRAVMIECDDCLGGFHLKCLKPPLKKVPEGDWVCGFCEARKLSKEVKLPVPPEGKKLVRTMREKLLSNDLWVAHIER